MKNRAIFPGSFDPFTIGHYDIVQRGLTIFDEIIIAVGINQTKKTLFTTDERMAIIQEAFAHHSRVKVMSYSCLTVDFAKEMGAQSILRGLRTATDFEYERAIADANKQLSGIETVMLLTDAKYAFVSSTLVRDLHTFGKDISAFLPPKQQKEL